MSVIFKINGVDKTSSIDTDSVNLSRAITNQIDTLSFSVKRADSTGYKPAINDVVVIEEDSVKIFGGIIVSLEDSFDAYVETTRYTCSDFSFDMDKKLVVKSYEDKTVNEIIEDIKTYFLPSGYTTTNVNCTAMINYIAFNYEYPSKCFQQLAQITDYDWYVDEEKNIYFFQKGTINAPFDITDTNENHIYSSLKIKKDIKNIRNSIIVRGGTYQGATEYEEQTADGETFVFTFGYKYSNVVFTVDGVAQTVGIDFINDPAGFDVLYNFQEKAIKFPTGSKPTAGQTVRITGNPHIPVVTKFQDTDSVNTYGEFQFKIIDKSIGSRQAARDRARAEIAGWGMELNEGGFTTYKAGLKVGQKIRIQSAVRGIDEYFIISRIASTIHRSTTMKHNVTLITKLTYGVIEFLQNLLIAKDKEIEIYQDEVLDTVTLLNDSFGITDQLTVLTPTSGPYKWQPDSLTPVSPTPIRWNYWTWSA